MDARLHQRGTLDTWIDWARGAADHGGGGRGGHRRCGDHPRRLVLPIRPGLSAHVRSAWSSATPIISAFRLRSSSCSANRSAVAAAILLAALAVIAGLMLWNAGLAGYHAGVEWKWWPGPNTCGGAPDLGGGGNLLKQLQSINVVRCDEAAWTIPRAVARRLQRADLARARRRRAVGIPGRPQNAAATRLARFPRPSSPRRRASSRNFGSMDRPPSRAMTERRMTTRGGDRAKIWSETFAYGSSSVSQ